MKTSIPFFLFYLSLPLSLLGQNPKEHIVFFRGYVFDEDSVPARDAHLINYRTLKIIITDTTGYFATYLYEGDSLMINHLSLAPKVIHANAKPARENKSYVPFRINMLRLISANEVRYKMEMKYAEENINILYAEMERKGLRNPAIANISGSMLPFRMMMGPGGMGGISLNALNLSRIIRESRIENANKKHLKKKMAMDSINYVLRQKEKTEGIFSEEIKSVNSDSIPAYVVSKKKPEEYVIDLSEVIKKSRKEEKAIKREIE